MNQELNGFPQKVEEEEILKGWEALQKKRKVVKKNDTIEPTLKIVHFQSKWRQSISRWIRKIKNYWNK